MTSAGGRAELPASVELEAGTTADVVLPGLGTAGYAWDASVEGPSGIVDVRLHRGGAGAAGNAQDKVQANAPGGGRRIGAAVPETLSVTGIAPGRVVVHLAQRRPWERGTPPRERHRVDVVVR